MDETEKISSAADVECSGSFLSNHVYKCNVLEADSE
jgi:hypothetical protein